MVLNFGGGIFQERDVRETPTSEGVIVPGDFCSLYRASNLVIGADTNLDWNAERSDTSGMHDLVVDPERILITTPGLYLIYVQASMTKGGGDSRLKLKLYDGVTLISQASTVASDAAQAQPDTANIFLIRNITASTYFYVTATGTDNIDGAADGSETNMVVMRLK